jgi:putative membrane protein
MFQTREVIMGRVLALIAVAFLRMPVAAARDTPMPAPGRITTTDRPTIQKLHDANQLEIQMGHLAQQKGVSKAVRELGRMLTSDHEQVDRQLDDYLKKHGSDLKGLGTTTSVDADHDLLATKTSGEFDRAFGLQMVSDHQQSIDLLESARLETADDTLRDMYDALLPMLRKHKAAAQRIIAASIRS